MALNCAAAFTHVPESCKDGNGLLLPKGLVVTTPGQSFATKALAGDEANWISDIIADNAYHLPKIKEVEDLTAESTNWESASGDIVFLFEGKIRMKFTYYASVEQHQALRAYTGKRGNLYIYDRNGSIMGTSPDGTIFKGFTMSYINVETLKPATADTPALSVIEIQLENPAEFNEALAIVEPFSGTIATRWYPYNLPNKTKTIIVQQGSIVADVVTFKQSYQSSSVTNNDGNPVIDTPITGLDVITFTNHQFVVAGVVTAPSAMTEVGEGIYTATLVGIAAADTISGLATTDDTYFADSLALI